MPRVEPHDLSFPVLCLARDASIVVAASLEDLCRCNALAFWGNQYYRDLRIFDSTGASYAVAGAEPERSFSAGRRFLARVFNRRLAVRLQIEAQGPPSLEAAKQRTSEWLDRAPEFWRRPTISTPGSDASPPAPP